MNDDWKGEWILLLIIGIPCLLIGAGYGQLFYGDWRCGFIECRVVAEASP